MTKGTLFQVAKRANETWFPIFYAVGFLIAMGAFNVVAHPDRYPTPITLNRDPGEAAETPPG